MRQLLAACIFAWLLAGGAIASPSADLFVKHVEGGTLGEGISALSPAAEAGEAEALAARGSLRFLVAIEHLAQAFHRHGLETASGGPMINLPVLRLPVPPNPKAEKLDYRAFRAIFERLVADLDAADTDLAKVAEADIKLPIDLAKARLDLDGDGKASDYESLGGIVQGLTRGDPIAAWPAAFDTGDIYWLRGYANFIAGFAQFMLAHDFEATFDKTFHLYFPHAGLPLAEKLARTGGARGWDDGAAGDAIAFLHLINWKVTDRARLLDTRNRFMAMAQLSRRSWDAIRRESDDDREWLPNAKQRSAALGLPVSDQEIDGWLAVMAEFEAILDGRKLLPHWRFDEGLNVKRMFEQSASFDFVLLVAGADAVPWLEAGPVSTSADWDSLMGTFGGHFLGYAMWFN